MRPSASFLLLVLAKPATSTKSFTLEHRYDETVPSTNEVVNWGATCPYPLSAAPNARALDFDLKIRPELLPALAAGYDWGTTCTLKNIEFIVVPNGTHTLAERRAALPSLPEVGCDSTMSKGNCRKLLPALIIAVIYMFYMMAVTCDEYLVPSLNVLCERTSIPDDVAGATLMAAGCNAPEFFSVITSTFATPSTVGPGAILGSAPFNLLMIIAAASFAVGGMRPDPWLMLREIVSLAVAVTALILVMRDNVVLWWEAFILMVLYVFYVLLCVYTQSILAYFRGNAPTAAQTVEVAAAPAENTAVFTAHAITREVRDSEAAGKVRLSGVLLKQSRFFTRKMGVPGREWAQRFFELSDSERMPMRYAHLGADGAPLVDGWTTVDLRACLTVETARVVGPDGTAMSEIRLKPADGRAWTLRCAPEEGQRWADEIRTRIDELRRTGDALDGAHADGAHDVVGSAVRAHVWYAVGPGVYGKVWWVFTVWVKGILYYTVPNPLNPKLTKYYLLALGISAGWLAAQAYVMTLCLNYLGCALGISQIVMGNTIGAIGTSFPNLVASVITARQGFSGMSACQAIGANTFNILVALGLIWFIQALAGQCQYGPRSTINASCNGCFMPVGYDISCPRVPGAPYVGTPGSILGTSFVVYTNLALLAIALVVNRGTFTKASCWIFMAYYLIWFVYQFAASTGAIPTLCILGDICI